MQDDISEPICHVLTCQSQDLQGLSDFGMVCDNESGLQRWEGVCRFLISYTAHIHTKTEMFNAAKISITVPYENKRSHDGRTVGYDETKQQQKMKLTLEVKTKRPSELCIDKMRCKKMSQENCKCRL